MAAVTRRSKTSTAGLIAYLARATITCLVACLVASCGDGLVSQDYRGEPLFTIEGQISALTGSRPGSRPLSASLFWSKSGETSTAAANLVEQPALAKRVAFPSAFEINIFEPPRGEGLPDAGLLVGMVLVYEDVDGDQMMSPGELRGGAPESVVIHATRPFAKGTSTFARDIPAGYSLVRLPTVCECGVEIGAACTSDAECAPGGYCADTVLGRPAPGGYCMSPEGSCTPEDSIALTDLDNPDAPPVHVRTCAADSDCRQSEGYVCCSGLCIPDDPGSGCGPPNRCDIRLGAACSSDATCGADGVCLQRLGVDDLPGGYCTALVDDMRCGVPNALRLTSFDSPEYWVLNCTTDEDCRTDEGYVCDPFFRGCLPRAPVSLSITPAFVMNKLCSRE